MKKLYFLFITFMVCSLSFGQILSDDFNYTDNALLTANGWTVSSAGTNSMDVGASNGLTYTDYSGTTGFTGVVVGNAVKVDNTGEDLTKSFAADVTSGTLYYSFLLNVTDATAGYFTMVGKGSAFAARVFVKPSSTGKFNIGLSNSSTAAYATTPTDFNLNTTYLVIVKYDVNATATASIWVKSSGVPATELAAGTPEHTTSGSGTAVIAGVFLRQYAATQNLTIDGIRVYSTWFGETPCALTLLAETTACTATTNGIDAYTATIPFTGGNTASYTLSTSNGTISGDNPSTTAAGSIIITGVNEGTNITLSISGGCTISRTITAPECKITNPLPVSEPFNYSPGTTLNTSQTWTNMSSGADEITTISGNLSYAGITATGNSVSFVGTGSDTKLPFTVLNSGTVYYSFLMNIGSMTGVTELDGGYFAGIGESSTSLGATLWTKRVDDTNFNLGIEVRTGTAANTTYSAASYQTGQTYFVVVGYTFNTATGADDVVSLWVNPTVNAAMPATTLTDSHTGTDLLNASSFFLRQDSATETPAVQVDELRIGTAWADVVPQTAGINDNNINGLTMYPNPVSGNTLYLTSTANAAMSVQIFDLLGKEVLKATVVNNAVNVAKLTAGVYVVKITEEGKTATRKLVIK
jgi:hypothetical protein